MMWTSIAPPLEGVSFGRATAGSDGGPSTFAPEPGTRLAAHPATTPDGLAEPEPDAGAWALTPPVIAPGAIGPRPATSNAHAGTTRFLAPSTAGWPLSSTQIALNRRGAMLPVIDP